MRGCQVLNSFQVVMLTTTHWTVDVVDLSMILHLMHISCDVLQTTSTFTLCHLCFAWDGLINHLASLSWRCLGKSGCCHGSRLTHWAIIKGCLRWSHLAVSTLISTAPSTIAWSCHVALSQVLWHHPIDGPVPINQGCLAFASRLVNQTTTWLLDSHSWFLLN